MQDTGIGIGADQLDIIFKPFEQAGEGQHRLGGTGLGLTISRQFVRLMGGDIKVESRVGEGSTFWFALALPVSVSKAGAARAPSVAGYQGPRKKILVVDDIAENRAVAVDMLSQIGFEMSEAANGEMGLEQAQALQPDLILMDIELADGQSFEIFNLAQVKSPVIFITSYDEYALKAFKVNSVDYLLKPVQKEDLEMALDKYRDMKKLYATAPQQSKLDFDGLVKE